tara:strand:- start:682 stop:864 length:183 start_codon:yes stop_codon:yes gene_type:complete
MASPTRLSSSRSSTTIIYVTKFEKAFNGAGGQYVIKRTVWSWWKWDIKNKFGEVIAFGFV